MIISIANEKGGVAKTTTVAALGSVLSKRGYRVILVDLDSQSDLTVSLNVDPGGKNIFDCIFTSKRLVASKVNPNLVLVGGSPSMTPGIFSGAAGKEPELENIPPELVLHHFMSDKKDKADFILLDCPPNLELITQNALGCSDYLLIPTEPHSFSINGIESMLDYASELTQEVNKDLKVLGFFLTRFRKSTSLHMSVRELLKRKQGKYLLETTIHENVTVQEATHMGTELEAYGDEKEREAVVKGKKVFRGLADYQHLADEILTRIEHEK